MIAKTAISAATIQASASPDTYFIVAHLHYVLLGGFLFPLFGAFYYR